MAGINSRINQTRTPGKKSDVNLSLESKNDSELIQRIAAHSDREAFSELFRRYEKVGYQVAKHVSSDHHLAEEALLDAMHRIWRSAHSFNADGNARGWIIRIIARSSLKGLERKMRHGKREQEDVHELGLPGKPLNEDRIESVELEAGLKNSLKELSALDRNIMALRFVGGLSQAEIGIELSMSQRTVSERIRQSLESLRKSLTRSGLAAALPLISNEGITNAICEDRSRPRELLEKALNRISESDHASGISFRVWMSGMIIFVLLALGMAVSHKIFSSFAPEDSAVEKSEGASVASIKRSNGFVRRYWDFDEPNLDGLSVSGGEWIHLPSGGMDGSGCMRVSSKSNLNVEMEISPSDLPVEITFNVRMIKELVAKSLFGWRGRAPSATILRSFSKVALLNHWVHGKCIVTTDAISVWLDNEISFIAFYNNESDKPSSLNFSLLSGWKIDGLEIRKISSKSIPDITSFARAVDEIPPEKRQHFNLLSRLTETGKKERRMFRAVFNNVKRNLELESETQTWRFQDSNELQEFALIEGAWRFLPKGGKHGTGCIEWEQQKFSVLFNCNNRAVPFVITGRFRGRSEGKTYAFPTLFWINLNSRNAYSRFIVAPPKFSKRSLRQQWVTVQYYVSNRYIDMWVDGQRVLIDVTNAKQYGLPQLYSRFRTQMDFLEVKAIAQKDLPELGRYHEAVERRFERIYGDSLQSVGDDVKK